MSITPYPPAPRSDAADVYHGATVADPFRPLEDADAPETKAWVDAQNAVTQAFLSSVPRRGAIHARLTALTDYERFGLPEKTGDRYFFTRNTGLQNQSVLYVAGNLADAGRVLLDPNTLSPDGTVALSGTAVAASGEYLAYALAESGSDWNTWRIRDVSTGTDLPDEVRWSKFGGAAWAKDGSGFYYSRYDEPAPGAELSAANYNQKLFFHQIGTAQADDTLVYERPDHPDWGFYAQVSDDGAFLVITATQGTDEKNRLFYRRLGEPGALVLPLFADLDASYDFVGNDTGGNEVSPKDVFYIRTNNAAPMYRLVAVDVANPDPGAWRTLIAESETNNLRGVSLFGDTFIASYLRDARTVLQTFDITGTALGEIALPGIGAAGGFTGHRNDTETFYGFTGFTAPYTTYRYDLTTGESSVFRSPQVAFDPAEYETRQIFYPSKDGTSVPMFVTHKKGVALDGNNPTYLYGYGGFNVSLTPFFSVNALVWMEMGGVYAVANLRGGGEYGEKWHEAGMKTRKQNVFDDFIAAGEYLIREGYTRSAKLAIAGGSNGGLLVGACMNQRPDLFAACLPAVGVMDMIRFPKFTIGWAWQADYGSPDNADEFAALLAYSPLHNLREGTAYPATLVLTSDHDDRVVPAHSYKYAARLQECQAGDAPVLIRIETQAGHGAGKPVTKQIDQTADMYAFLVRVLEMG